MLMFGLGGIYVEILKDIQFAIAPVDEKEAREMITGIKTYPLLAGIRGKKPSDIDALVYTILKVSRLVCDFPEIEEFEINPMGSLVFENTTGSSVACNVVGTNYKCDSWSNVTADNTNTADIASTEDIANTADIANTEDNVSNITDVCSVVSTSYKWVSNEQYPVIDLFGDKYVPLFNTNESIWDAHA